MEKELFLLHELPEDVRDVALKNTYHLHAYWHYTYDRIVDAVEKFLEASCPNTHEAFEFGFEFNGVFGEGMALSLGFFHMVVESERGVCGLCVDVWGNEPFYRYPSDIFSKIYGDGSLDAGVHVVVRSNKPYDEVRVAQREVQNWYKVLYDGASYVAMNELRRYEGIGLLHDWAVESRQRYDSNGVANKYTK